MAVGHGPLGGSDTQHGEADERERPAGAEDRDRIQRIRTGGSAGVCIGERPGGLLGGGRGDRPRPEVPSLAAAARRFHGGASLLPCGRYEERGAGGCDLVVWGSGGE